MSDTTNTDSDRQWTSEPPSQRRPRRDWSGTAEDLRAHKGEWTKVDSNTSSPGLTSHINRGHLVAFRPAGDFEARSTKNPEGKYDIHARFVGEVAASD